MQYKTGVFKAVVLQNDFANHAQQERRWRENQETEEGSSFTKSTQQKTETSYFLRITVLEARDLPKMDGSKHDACYNDTYVRLTMRGNGKIIETADGHDAIFNTAVVWDQKDPKFNAHFDFDVPPPHKVQSVTLTVEVFDVDTKVGGGHHEDHLIGFVDFNIIKDSARAMPMEKEFHEWNSLDDRQVALPSDPKGPPLPKGSTTDRWPSPLASAPSTPPVERKATVHDVKGSELYTTRSSNLNGPPPVVSSFWLLFSGPFAPQHPSGP